MWKSAAKSPRVAHSPVRRADGLLLQRLKVAYVNKERAAQYQENLLLRQVENDKEQAIADKVRVGSEEVGVMTAPHRIYSRRVPPPRQLVDDL